MRDAGGQARGRKSYPSQLINPFAPSSLPLLSHTTNPLSLHHPSPSTPISIPPTSFTMSAVADSTEGPIEQVKVLFALFPGYNTLDVAGPLEVLSRSLQDPKDKGTRH